MTLAKHWKYGKDEDLVLTHLKGLAATNPTTLLIPSERVLYSNQSNGAEKVTLISGGGGGHEPLHAGYVGTNLLDAAVSGSVFASPSTKQIMSALVTKSDKKKGTLIIVKNYTGDILHFGLVAERAKSEGHNVELLAVTDDVAVGRKQNAMVGRRALAGTALVHKIVGGLAGTGADLQDVYKLGKLVNANLVTLGASLDRTSVPGKAAEEMEFTADNEAELGLGIHNEPGVKMSPIPNIDDLVKDMFHKLLSPEDEDRHYVDFDLKNDEYVLLINNIGGTSTLELLAITEHVLQHIPLSKKPKRVLVSDFVTSLNAPGFSITLLNLSNMASADSSHSIETVLKYLDAPTDAPGWKPKVYDSKLWGKEVETIESPMKHTEVVTSDIKMDADKFETSLRSALKNLKENEPKITHYDTLVGDGDCGETLVDGANAILNALEKDKKFKERLTDPVATLSVITELVEDSMGGTSGGLYSIYLTAFVKHLQTIKELGSQEVGKALKDALYDGLFKYTNARVGGRTLVDTLQPFVDSLSADGDLSKALTKAREGCESTKELQAKFGRASYVNDDEFKSEEGGIPDPGALGLLSIIEGFLKQ